MHCIGCRDRHATTSFVHNKILLSWLHSPPPITLGEIASYYQFVLHTLKPLAHDSPPTSCNGWRNELLVPYISGKPSTPIRTIDITNPCRMNLCFHNTLSLLLLRNAPPDEVCNAILIVLCLNSLATSIGFGVYRFLHIL